MGYHDRNGTYHAYHGWIPLSLVTAREAASTGDVGAIAANGGILASDTTPALSGTGSTVSQQALWAATNVDQLLWDVGMLPEDFDGHDDVIVELWVASGGTTDLASFSVLTSWDGAANVTDTATDPAASTSYHKITATISAADIPDVPTILSVAIVPAAHGTDTVACKGGRILYTPRAV